MQRTAWSARLLVGLCIGAVACGGSNGGAESDAGPHDAAAGEVDARAPDAGCADAGCCEEEALCGPTCCGSGEVCSFEQCVSPGDDCSASADCPPSQYCEYSLGEDPGQGGGEGCTARSGKCLPAPAACDPSEEPGHPPSCLQACEYPLQAGSIQPELSSSWGEVGASDHHVMTAPVVTQLDDDNCDGVVDERDDPDLVFLTFTGNDYDNSLGTSATLRAVSIVGGEIVEKWSVEGTSDEPARAIAAGDVHPSSGNEIVVCAEDDRVRVYDSEGGVLWTSDPLGETCSMPSIANLDQSGAPEVIVKGAVLEGDTGDVKTPLDLNENVVVSDVTGDGALEIVTPTRVLDASGALIADASESGVSGTHPAVADLDGDGAAEIVAVDFLSHSLSVWQVVSGSGEDHAVVRQGVDLHGSVDLNHCCETNPSSAGCTRGGGPPVIADFDGDGSPDVGVAAGVGYAAFGGAELMDGSVQASDTLSWFAVTQDCSSAQTGSTAFDLDGDGSSEVLYADERTFRVYSGANGAELFATCNTSGTILEYPLVADVDGDGHAEIVVPSNSYSALSCAGTKTTGIRVFEDPSEDWGRTRRAWNQHAYHVTNISEGGGVPDVEPPNPESFRANALVLAAPDLVAEVSPRCGGGYAILARVRNLGERFVDRGVEVRFYAGDPGAGGALLGERATTRPLAPLESEDVLLEVPAPAEPLYVVLGAGGAANPSGECRVDNNVAGPVEPSCPDE